jgi:hypothetical protein
MDNQTLTSMLAGAIMLNAWAISVFFLRFWKKSRDPLFMWFAIAFLLLGLERIVVMTSVEVKFQVYLIRLTAFLLIIFGIWNKNAKRSRP